MMLSAVVLLWCSVMLRCFAVMFHRVLHSGVRAGGPVEASTGAILLTKMLTRVCSQLHR